MTKEEQRDARKREVTFRAAFDKRHDDPNQDYGVHGAEIKFVLRGPEGAVQFVIYTNWHLPHVAKEMAQRCATGPTSGMSRAQYVTLMFAPMGADVGYHSPTPRHEGQTAQEDCPYLDGRPCYYDGSGLLAEEVLAKLIASGDEAVWAELHDFYEHHLAAAPELACSSPAQA